MVEALIITIALELGVPANLALAVATVENPAYDPYLIGPGGDLGIMQLNPRYLDWFKEKYWDRHGRFDWREPKHNIYVGLRHLKYLMSIHGWNTWQALIAYNCGEARLLTGRPPNASIEYANKVFEKYGEKRKIPIPFFPLF